MKTVIGIKIKVLILVTLLLAACCESPPKTTNLKKSEKFPTLQGPYLGMKLPGNKPLIFAPKIISTRFHEHSFPAFSPDGTEVFWNTLFIRGTYDFPAAILGMKKTNGIWSPPEYTNFNVKGNGHNPCFSPDGNTIYFAAVGEPEKDKLNLDIWYVNKTKNGWGKAKEIVGEINTNKPEGQVSVTKNGTLYFWSIYEDVETKYGIFRSELINGKYQKAVPLPQQINGKKSHDWTPFISPDESFILWSSVREGGYGSGDIYICFRSDKGEWSEAVNLGAEINNNKNERFPYISPDGKFLFFITDQVSKELLANKSLTFKDAVKYFNQPKNGMSDIYWVSTKVIEDLRFKYQSKDQSSN